ncbi:MAG: hypothetical protein FJY42_15575 [Betaproteobacteria bacterium]|nr:hypothetical protein [Betaproteobacteria bacterium]
MIIELPDNPSTKRTIDLSAWLGRGIDPGVHACASQLRAFVVGKSVQPSTADSYWTRGLIHFFRFLTTCSGPAAPGLLKPNHILAFIAWLAEQGWSTGTRKVRYNKTKSVLPSLLASGLIPRHDDLFPANPHPGSNSSAKGQLPLSMGERDRLGKALRDDLIAIHHGKFAGTQSEALVVYLLALDLRCGANPTPLLEAGRDCLMDHPFIPNMKRLALYKRRGNATKISSLRFSQTRDEEVSIPKDGIGLALQVLKMTQPLVAHAAPKLRDRLWLYRSERPRDNGRVIVLTKNSLDDGITAVVDRHSLKGDDGEPLRLNVSRLRKTVELRSGTCGRLSRRPTRRNQGRPSTGQVIPEAFREAVQNVLYAYWRRGRAAAPWATWPRLQARHGICRPTKPGAPTPDCLWSRAWGAVH